MKIVDFKGSNVVFAKDQPEYLPLPAYIDEEGAVTSCWQPSFKEKIRLLFGYKLYLTVLTFQSPLQPQLLEVKKQL